MFEKSTTDISNLTDANQGENRDYALKGHDLHLALGIALGFSVHENYSPCKGKSIIIQRLLPRWGDCLSISYSQGDALGYELVGLTALFNHERKRAYPFNPCFLCSELKSLRLFVYMFRDFHRKYLAIKK